MVFIICCFLLPLRQGYPWVQGSERIESTFDLPPFSGFPRVRDPYAYVKPFDFINVENFYTKFIGI